MELLQLQYFVEIAKLESVTNTAKKLRVSQPSLSQTMRRLEKELGTKLFKKEGRRLKLTPRAGSFTPGSPRPSRRWPTPPAT